MAGCGHRIMDAGLFVGETLVQGGNENPVGDAATGAALQQQPATWFGRGPPTPATGPGFCGGHRSVSECQGGANLLQVLGGRVLFLLVGISG